MRERGAQAATLAGPMIARQPLRSDFLPHEEDGRRIVLPHRASELAAPDLSALIGVPDPMTGVETFPLEEDLPEQ